MMSTYMNHFKIRGVDGGGGGVDKCFSNLIERETVMTTNNFWHIFAFAFLTNILSIIIYLIFGHLKVIQHLNGGIHREYHQD